MKLRNKKTGDILPLQMTINGKEYQSLAEFNEDWKDLEDYKPTEPLIKDEDKLDAVKSFFLKLGITKDIYFQLINNCFCHTNEDGISYSIDFVGDNGIENLCIGMPYTLAELCGEEEE